jgi:hypothetical protein
MADIVDVGAELFQTDLLWRQVAPDPPVDPADPADPAYDWTGIDRAVRAAAAVGLRIQLLIYRTPDWLDPSELGNHAPPAWELRGFATAVGRRYSGRYRPSPYAAPLPRVGRFVAWNEPNLHGYITPQFRMAGQRLVSVAPRLYATILRSIRDGLRAGMRLAGARPPLVAGGATAPKGDRHPRTARATHTPQRFITELARFRPVMDAWAQHAYPLGQPRFAAPRRDGPMDAWNVTAVPGLLDRAGGPLRGLPVWITETGVPTSTLPWYGYAWEGAEAGRVLSAMFRRASSARRIREFVLYFLQDHPRWRTGLRDEAFRPKPTWFAACRAFWEARGGLCAGPADPYRTLIAP